MKHFILLFAVIIATSCSNGEIDPTLEVTSSTSEKITEAQDVNIELEEIDGELDSLLTITK